ATASLASVRRQTNPLRARFRPKISARDRQQPPGIRDQHLVEVCRGGALCSQSIGDRRRDVVVAPAAVAVQLQAGTDVVGEQQLAGSPGVEEAHEAVDALAVGGLTAAVAVVLELSAEGVEAEHHPALGDLAMPLRLDELVTVADRDAAQVGPRLVEDVDDPQM